MAKRRAEPKAEPRRRRVLVRAAVAVGVAVAGIALGLAIARRGPLSAERVLAAWRDRLPRGGLAIVYPSDQTFFPPEIVAPNFRWSDPGGESDAWVVSIEFADGGPPATACCLQPHWTPSDEEWERLKDRMRDDWARVAVLGVNQRDPGRVLAAAEIRIRTSPDEVGSPIFYREVNLPFLEAVKDPSRIRWRFGAVSSKRPPIVLEGLAMCGNCHSFSADGKVLGMDVDYANDKGSYLIDQVAEEMVVDKDKIITWSDYKREDGELTFGMLSQVSPDGRYVLSTVKDRSVFVPKDDLAFSQLFFPFKGILAVYDRKAKEFHALPGADDPQFVQTNPAWSPDGKHVVFARSKAHRAENLRSKDAVLLTKEECREFLEGQRTFQFDLYRVPFNEGRGGKAEPLEGASGNGMSNYFPKFSPDGRWIVFCRAKTFMLLQPDSELWIVPASGGQPRRLSCNTARMNSWHSWSPNGRWLVFVSKAWSDYTQLFLTHIDEQGQSSPPVVLAQFTDPDRAANIPEFVNAGPEAIRRIRERFVDEYSYLRIGHDFFDRGYHDAAARFYAKALEYNAKNPEVHNNLGIALLSLGRAGEAKSHFREAIRLKPDLAKAHNNLGNALVQEGRIDEGTASLREALRIDPRLVNARLALGTVLFETGKTDEGRVHLAEAVRLEPHSASANYHYGRLLDRQGNLAQAAAHYRLAVDRDPNAVPAMLALAMLRATGDDAALRDGAEAVQLATRACQATLHRDPAALEVLAAAYAEAGRFSEAASTALRAHQMFRGAGMADRAAAMLQQAQRYTERRPLRRIGKP